MKNYNSVIIPMTVADNTIIVPAKISSNEQTVNCEVSTSIVQMAEDYIGDYNLIPTNEQTILQTKGHIMKDNITIEPIPKNYGLITWNGSVLTIT